MARILLIEDNEMNRDMLSRRLRRAGHFVIETSTALRGIELAREQQPDIILMDLRLPDLDGWTAARQIKRDEHIRRIPLIALTAHVMEGDREKALDAGCDDYDIKPIDLPRLLGKIRHLLESPSGLGGLHPDSLGGDSCGGDSLPLN